MIFFSTPSIAQGCSDAGFCTAGAMQSASAVQDSSTVKNSYGASVTLGAGEKNTTILSPQIEANFPITRNSYLEAKLPYIITNGNLGEHSGIGDLIVTYSRDFTIKGTQNGMTATLGSRIGTGNASFMDNGQSLPMPYQTSLGTTDIIAGLSMKFLKYVNVVIGFQQPVIQYNDNGYLPDTVYPVNSTDQLYFASKELERKGDVLLRVEGSYAWKRISVSAGPLLIYHLGTDSYRTAAGIREQLTGSDGATLNISGSVSYKIKSGKIDILAGMPVLVRDYRPDGLTRSMVVTIRYTLIR